MATYTTNYNLAKPGSDDVIDIGVLNNNFDTIDEKIKEAADAIPPVATQEVAGIVKPDGTTVTVEEDGTIHGAQTYVLPPATVLTLGGVIVGENLTVTEDGKLNAYAGVTKDDIPTAGSDNVPTSGGTYSMIDAVNSQVNILQSQVTALTTGLTWKEAVSTYDDIATTYPSPSVGWVVTCTDTGKSYYYDGADWVYIFTSQVPVASVADIRAVLNLSS